MHHSKTIHSLTHAHMGTENNWFTHTKLHAIQARTNTQILNPSIFNAFVKLNRNTRVPLYEIRLFYCSLAVAIAAAAAICLVKYWRWNCVLFVCSLFISQNTVTPFKRSFDMWAWVIRNKWKNTTEFAHSTNRTHSNRFDDNIVHSNTPKMTTMLLRRKSTLETAVDFSIELCARKKRIDTSLSRYITHFKIYTKKNA